MAFKEEYDKTCKDIFTELEKTKAGTGTGSSIATDRLWWNRKNDRNYSDGG